MKKSTLYLIASLLMLVAFVLGLVQALRGEGWVMAAVPFALGAMMMALWSRARATERS